QEPIITATTATTTTLPPPPPSPQQRTIDPDLATRVSALETICANFEKKIKLQDKTTQALSSRVYVRRSIRLTPVPNVDKAEEMILQDTLQVSLAEHKSRQEHEAIENVALNVVDDSSSPRNDNTTIPGTRLEPRSDKESLEVEISKDKEVEQTNEAEVDIPKETSVDVTKVVIPINVDDEDEEITD
ncbi:hypothetical protein Tco_1317736, partial [Tanacetum coccineum]